MRDGEGPTKVEWLNVLGLACDAVGTGWLAWGLFLSRARAVELGVSRFAGDTLEANLRLPAVEDRLRQSRNAMIGTGCLFVGFCLQIVASWPN